MTQSIEKVKKMQDVLWEQIIELEKLFDLLYPDWDYENPTYPEEFEIIQRLHEAHCEFDTLIQYLIRKSNDQNLNNSINGSKL